MTGTAEIAVRNGSAPAAQTGTLAIYEGQTHWTEMQQAAFGQLGIRDAGDGDRAVFLHVSQRTGLDPFARQIYMIPRSEKLANGQWGKKWTIQTGIEGWRVIRDRAERREGVRGILSRFTYYDPEGKEHKVWVRREPPVACEVTYTVRDRNTIETPYTSVLRMDEYMQVNKDGEPVAQWAVKDVHMLEKCTEADVYRKAFPQDYSGVYLEDAMPPADPDAPPVQPERPRVTAADVRHHRPAVTVVPENVPPAQPQAPAAPATPVQPGAGGALPPLPGEEDEPAPAVQDAPAAGAVPDDAPGSERHRKLVGVVQAHFKRLGYNDERREERLVAAAVIAATGDIESLNDLHPDELSVVADTLAKCRNSDALKALIVAADKAAGDE